MKKIIVYLIIVFIFPTISYTQKFNISSLSGNYKSVYYDIWITLTYIKDNSFLIEGEGANSRGTKLGSFSAVGIYFNNKIVAYDYKDMHEFVGAYAEPYIVEVHFINKNSFYFKDNSDYLIKIGQLPLFLNQIDFQDKYKRVD